MQLQAVIDLDEIIFVDNHGYAVKDGHGGRLVVLAWEMTFHSSPDSLNEPLPIEVVYYGPERHEVHRRLMGEFTASLNSFEARLKQDSAEDRVATILPFRT